MELEVVAVHTDMMGLVDKPQLTTTPNYRSIPICIPILLEFQPTLFVTNVTNNVGQLTLRISPK